LRNKNNNKYEDWFSDNDAVGALMIKLLLCARNVHYAEKVFLSLVINFRSRMSKDKNIVHNLTHGINETVCLEKNMSIKSIAVLFREMISSGFGDGKQACSLYYLAAQNNQVTIGPIRFDHLIGINAYSWFNLQNIDFSTITSGNGNPGRVKELYGYVHPSLTTFLVTHHDNDGASVIVNAPRAIFKSEVWKDLNATILQFLE
jgi:hypothetical protein